MTKFNRSSTCKSVLIKSKKQLQLALIGTKLFYSANGSNEVKYFDIETRKCKDLDLKTY